MKTIEELSKWYPTFDDIDREKALKIMRKFLKDFPWLWAIRQIWYAPSFYLQAGYLSDASLPPEMLLNDLIIPGEDKKQHTSEIEIWVKYSDGGINQIRKLKRPIKSCRLVNLLANSTAVTHGDVIEYLIIVVNIPNRCEIGMKGITVFYPTRGLPLIPLVKAYYDPDNDDYTYDETER